MCCVRSAARRYANVRRRHLCNSQSVRSLSLPASRASRLLVVGGFLHRPPTSFRRRAWAASGYYLASINERTGRTTNRSLSRGRRTAPHDKQLIHTQTAHHCTAICHRHQHTTLPYHSRICRFIYTFDEELSILTIYDITPPLVRRQSIAMSMYVSVSAREHISRAAHPIFASF